jgi:hypothetical protein
MKPLKSTRGGISMYSKTLTAVATVLSVLSMYAATAQDVLVLQDNDPWGFSYWFDQLSAYGLNSTVLDSTLVATAPLEDFDLVIVPSQQDGTFNDTINNNMDRFEDYVIGGGNLILMLSTWTAYTPYGEPPFGAEGYHDAYASYSYNVAPSHPLMAGVPATSNTTYASHGRIENYGSAEVLTTNEDNDVTSIFLQLGCGAAFVSYLTMEWSGSYDVQPIGANAIDYMLNTMMVDADGDGYGTDVCGGDDCDDANPLLNPAALEVACDYLDNDCDGLLHELEADDDGDGASECQNDCDDADATLNLQDADGDGYTSCGGDCDDTDPALNLDDIDGDGYGTCDGDCDPLNHAVHPGATEVCNDVDDNCDGNVDEGLATQAWYPDADGDGYGDASAPPLIDCVVPPGHVTDHSDCDDADPTINPAATESCNGADDDCDGEVDEADADGCDPWYLDGDGDGFGDPTGLACLCAAAGDHTAATGDDCDDGNPAVNPGQAEVACNGIDDDCDPASEDAPDGDGDGDDLCADCDDDDPALNHADDDGDGISSCDGDCDDAAAAVFPGNPEQCDGLDNDCDPATDEDADLDGDGFSLCDGDCDEEDPDVYPDAEEVCNGVDDDCDPTTDEDADLDGDGFSLCDGDCDDGTADVFPGNPEQCDGLDNDCDGLPLATEVDVDGDGQMICDGDCDDADSWTYDGAPEQCDQLDNDCDQLVDEDVDEDVDGDGFNACQGDCDNLDPAVYPGAAEICDGVDDDCDGELPADELDGDADGWMLCDGDCDDEDPEVHPDAGELCDDGIDNNCDGLTDDEDEQACPSGDDDTADDDTADDDTADDDSADDDDIGDGGCECESSQAGSRHRSSGLTPSALLIAGLLGLVAVRIARRRP